jgi:hypothetical protein
LHIGNDEHGERNHGESVNALGIDHIEEADESIVDDPNTQAADHLSKYMDTMLQNFMLLM